MAPKLRLGLQAAVIILAGGWAYWPAARGQWVSDDTLEITANPDLRDPAGLARIWRGADSQDYFPLKSTVQWLEWHHWHERTAGYHFVNLGLHLLSAFLLWRILQRLGVRLAWIGGLLFALHPLAVESVAWISELKNTLSLPLLLLAFGAYVDFEDGRAASLEPPVGPARPAPCPFRAYVWSVLGFALALLCKTSVIMFPALLLLYAWWRRGRIGRADLLACLPFAAFSLLLGVVTVIFQTHRAIEGFDLDIGGVSSRTTAAGIVTVFYLAKSVVPAAMTFVYPRWAVVPLRPEQFLPWLIWAALFCWLGARRGREGWTRHAVFGLGWFLINLIPVLGFVPMAYLRISWTADHFAYLSLLGLIGLAAAGLSPGGRRPPHGGSSALGVARLQIAGLAALCLVLAVQSRRHAADFQGEETLWTATLRENPSTGTAHNNLGVWLLKQGRPADAMVQLRQAVRLDPNYPEPRNNLGEALQLLGDRRAAIVQYQAALRLSTAYHQAAYNLGLCLFAEGRIPDAIAAYEQAIRFKPDFSHARNNLGVALARSGRFDAAIAQYREALRFDPNYPEAENNLGLALAKSGRVRESVAHFEAAVRLNPAYADARRNLRVALRKLSTSLGP